MPSTSTPPKNGPKRKSRRLRLGTFGGSYGDEYLPSEGQWAEIEAAIGTRFSEDDRAVITEIMQEYLDGACFERGAPFLADGLEYVEKIEAAGQQFQAALFGQPSEEKQQGAFAARAYIEKNFRGPYLPKGNAIKGLEQLIAGIEAACIATKRELQNDAVAGFEEGQAWDQMVRNLTALAQDRQWPTGASKGSDKAHSSKPSPFVALVAALQNTLPEISRRHTASDDALAAGISTARRKKQVAGD